jgi:hypothetical protein
MPRLCVCYGTACESLFCEAFRALSDPSKLQIIASTR